MATSHPHVRHTTSGANQFVPASLPPVELSSIFPVVLLFYATLLPLEMRFTIAEQMIYMPRLVAFACLPWLLYQISSGRMALRWHDGLVAVTSAWMIISFVQIYGLAGGFNRGAALALDVLLAYLIARAGIRSLTDLRRVLIFVAPGLFVAGLSLFVESTSGQAIVHPLAADIFGALPRYAGGEIASGARAYGEFRFGFLRAAGPFAHPILGGVTLGTMATIYFSSGLRGWPRLIGTLSGVAVLFTISSAGYLVLLFGTVLTAYDRLQKSITVLTWRAFIVVIGGASLLLEMFTSNGVFGIVSRLTLIKGNAYYRRLIWRFGTASVEQHPLFGIGFEGFKRLRWMVASVDNYWLLLAIRHGIIPSVCLLAVAAATVWGLARRASAEPVELDRRLYVSLASALFTIVLMGFTVAFFGSTLAWFMMLLGALASLTPVRRETAAPRPAPMVPMRPLLAARR